VGEQADFYILTLAFKKEGVIYWPSGSGLLDLKLQLMALAALIVRLALIFPSIKVMVRAAWLILPKTLRPPLPSWGARS
jgi:hypothetical protein